MSILDRTGVAWRGLVCGVAWCTISYPERQKVDAHNVLPTMLYLHAGWKFAHIAFVRRIGCFSLTSDDVPLVRNETFLSLTTQGCSSNFMASGLLLQLSVGHVGHNTCADLQQPRAASTIVVKSTAVHHRRSCGRIRSPHSLVNTATT